MKNQSIFHRDNGQFYQPSVKTVGHRRRYLFGDCKLIVYFFLLLSLFLASSQPRAEIAMDEYATYCRQAGGLVEEIPVIFHSKRGLITGYTKSFCLFNPDGNGQLLIGLETFASEQASIAATYIKTLGEIDENSTLWRGTASNPSFNVCKNLGGTSIGFATTGSFTSSLGDSDVCVFGDGSMVSAWSLIYMANHREGYDDVKNQVKGQPLDIQIKSKHTQQPPPSVKSQ